MTHKEIINKIRPEIDKVILFLDRELAKIRTGRATIALVEDITVECFEQKFPLKQLAALSTPSSNQINVQPWDKSYIEPIEKALRQSSIGFSIAVDKEIIRISLPALTEEFRKNLLRVLSEKQEDARKTIRKWREEAWKEVQEGFKESQIREDDKFRAKDELQKLIEEYNQKIEDLINKKKKEITE